LQVVEAGQSGRCYVWRLNGVVFVLLVFLTSFLGSIFMLFPLLPFAYFGTKFWRICADRLVGYWLTFPAVGYLLVYSIFFSRKFNLQSCHNTLDFESQEFFSLRRCCCCFIEVLSPSFNHHEPQDQAPLKRIPGAGWAMGCGSFVFLERNFETDKCTIASSIEYYKESGNNYQLLLFPEGTDRGARAAAQSNAFARENGLPQYDYVLHPRTTGFNYLLDVMRRSNYISYVYDVTVAYEDVIVDTEVRLLKEGVFPKPAFLTNLSNC
ncbi:hypothetical protein ANCDUO_08873, partial [Ancylostoma duodenale]